MVDREKDDATDVIAEPETNGHFHDHPDDEDLFYEEDGHWERLEELGIKLSSAGGMNFSEIDGFLHGVVCHPGAVPPSVFLPVIFGEETDALFTDEEVREAMKLILLHYHDILSMVEGKAFFPEPVISPPYEYLDEDDDSDPEDDDSDPDDDEAASGENATNAEEEGFAESFAALSDEEKKKLTDELEALNAEGLANEADWAEGFLHALHLGGGIERFHTAEPREEHALLMPVLMLAHNELPVEEDSPMHGKPLTPEAREWALRTLPSSLNGIYQLLHGPVRRVKVSRNDPCPCGSGKKYKKCCLNKQASEA